MAMDLHARREARRETVSARTRRLDHATENDGEVLLCKVV